MGRVRQTLCVFVFCSAEDGAAPKHGLHRSFKDPWQRLQPALSWSRVDLPHLMNNRAEKWAGDLQRTARLAPCLQPLTEEKKRQQQQELVFLLPAASLSTALKSFAVARLVQQGLQLDRDFLLVASTPPPRPSLCCPS